MLLPRMYWDSSILCYKNNHAQRTTRASARELELHVAQNCLGQLILIDVTVLNVVGGWCESKRETTWFLGVEIDDKKELGLVVTYNPIAPWFMNEKIWTIKCNESNSRYVQSKSSIIDNLAIKCRTNIMYN